MIIGRQFVESQYEEKLYSTGNDELDEMLEKAFCEGYEYAQKEFTSIAADGSVVRSDGTTVMSAEQFRDAPRTLTAGNKKWIIEKPIPLKSQQQSAADFRNFRAADKIKPIQPTKSASNFKKLLNGPSKAAMNKRIYGSMPRMPLHF